ncbi:MAG: phage/plasmid primase, P4 family [Candidatus Contendobacter sp.]|nr:phage/plasmid primase, P4 family [Candidatus Contendobacter sp.]
MSVLEEALTALERVTGYRPMKAGDGYKARCPCHEDRNPSLSVKMNGRLLLHCFAGCSYDRIVATLGLTPEPQPGRRELVATYRYRDAAGVEVRQKVRYAPKDFRIRYQDPAGQWVYKAGPGPAVLYRLPELRQAIAAGATVFVVEGEKDCDRLAAGGLAATTNIEGAAQPGQKPKWRAAYTAQLAGAARVVVLPDHDEPGRAHMAAIAQALQGQVGEVRLLELPGLPAKGDVSDWLNQGHTVTELLALAATAPAFPPPPDSTPTPVGPDPPTEPVEAVYCPPTVSPCTHLANSYRIRHYYQGRIWYALGTGWILWTGKFWQPDPTNEGAIAIGFVGGLSRKIAEEAAATLQRTAGESDSDRRTALMKQAEALTKWAIQSEHERVIASGLNLAKHALLVEHSTLDADPWLFNVQNGTVDLRTGQLHPHKSTDLITHIAPVTYDSAATCPTFERFISEVFAGDTGMVAFIQRAVGWSLTGVIEERTLFFLYGASGWNGKSTLVETIMALLGEYGDRNFGYARKVPAETFMKSRNMDDNERKTVPLSGTRFVSTSELSKEHRLNEQLIKDITGGDTLTAKRLYHESFSFKPQFKPWMYGNHKPEIRGTDNAIWSRVKLVPFEVSFEGRADGKLKTKLLAELPGILNWAIKGCLDWQRHGLQPPTKVQAATQAYRKEMDVIAAFFADCCVLHREARVSASALYQAYQRWCEQSGEYAEKQRNFGIRLTEHGVERYLGAKGYSWWRGIGLRAEVDDVDDVDQETEKSL